MKAKLKVKERKGKISKYIYGQFAEHLGRCIYEGIYVEDDSIPNVKGMRCDVVNALKELEIPVLRWPGGCFADDYHWRDGIGEKNKRPYMVNTNWGGVVENNHFGTHEFFELCEQLGTEPYICGNVGSGSVSEMRDWIEYMTFDGDSPLANERRKNGREEPWKLKFFGIGNEAWGCGGNMRAEYYSDLFRRYNTYLKNYGEEPLYRIACGADRKNTNWTDVVMKNVGRAMNAISLHNYSFEVDWNHKGEAVDFDETAWQTNMASAYQMKETIAAHKKVMDKNDPENNIALIVDEWGNWFNVEKGTNPGFLYQQNTVRDVVSGMMILHIFHENNDRVYMANIAQMINVLQAMVLTDGDKMVLTPTYYLFKLMKGHMNGERIALDYDEKLYKTPNGKAPKISMSASEKDEVVTLSACNTSLTEEEQIEIKIEGTKINSVTGRIITGEMNDCNTFENPNKVMPEDFEASLKEDILTFTLPAKSAVVLTIK